MITKPKARKKDITIYLKVNADTYQKLRKAAVAEERAISTIARRVLEANLEDKV